jgi:hypothetical protein
MIARLVEDGNAPTCPISFTQEKAERIDALDDSHRDTDGDMEQINELLGIGADGWTSNEHYESAKSKAAEIREQALASADDGPGLREMSERHWPFDDFGEDEWHLSNISKNRYLTQYCLNCTLDLVVREKYHKCFDIAEMLYEVKLIRRSKDIYGSYSPLVR